MACAAGLGQACIHLSLAPKLVNHFPLSSQIWLSTETQVINVICYILPGTTPTQCLRAGTAAALRLYGSRQKCSLCISKYLPENALFGSAFLTFAWMVFKKHPPSVSYCTMRRKSCRLTFQITNSPAIHAPRQMMTPSKAAIGCHQNSTSLQGHNSISELRTQIPALALHGEQWARACTRVCSFPFILPHVEGRTNTYIIIWLLI